MAPHKRKHDNSSKAWLTRDVLRELDRRNKISSLRSQHKLRPRGAKLAALKRLGIPDIAVFAAAGGPDLTSLRGYREPTDVVMASTRSQSKRSTKTGKTGNTGNTGQTRQSESTKFKPVHPGYEGACIRHNIFPPGWTLEDSSQLPEPANIKEIRAAIKGDSRCPHLTHDLNRLKERFRNLPRGNEDSIMNEVVPIILGDNCGFFTGYNVQFTLLDSLTGNTTTMPKPDLMDGAHFQAPRQNVMDSLKLAPTNHATVGVAPNFFLEAKSTHGPPEAALRALVLESAHGAQIIHKLQNYNKQKPVYDCNAYTFSATFYTGSLKLYVHHIGPPDEPQQTPNYYTMHLDTFPLDSYTYKNGFEDGLRAIRNLRYRAKDERERFIKEANEIDIEMCNANEIDIEMSGGAGNTNFVDRDDSEIIVEPYEENNQQSQSSRIRSTDDLLASGRARDKGRRRGRPRKTLYSPPPPSSPRHTERPARNQAESSSRRRSERIANSK
ncbi:hypothetical protein F5Y07DRAFT_122568 [Xylaria sp. FL0933]|nr:hypothetical protein F5Y07DRAFT_122568 [Xylaria sp. FL0933]